ncbi:AraC family transcriptional regulator [Chryseobacterium sp. T16E-39]|uniref:helix-turn-helix domain-containing protein n=1 Tax=Chryseobacterium sp. T16E-39 TaxID=2015076 RepID=UPI000B5B3A95|nr:AraC family transcriptional regulator [Chryseobacterium sp. T16E-39]ASK30416.1 AraC family transcriptional regulator [Chryseobacterium sp. T16E-39]
MNTLRNGEFFGQTNEIMELNGLTFTDTEYTHPYVDWHYHENAYFTFLLQGNVTEGNRKEIYDCSPGTLLYHCWEDSHYNIKPDVFTRGFHIEISKDWFTDHQILQNNREGSFNIKNPATKLLTYQIFKETKLNDVNTELSVHQLLLHIFSQFNQQNKNPEKNPVWVRQIEELLHESITEKLDLTGIAKILNIHPMHLSRDFHKYFHCNLGDYIRKLKVNRSLKLIHNNNESLTHIALECGFTDQSHFIRCFKENMGITPLKYRNLLVK